MFLRKKGVLNLKLFILWYVLLYLIILIIIINIYYHYLFKSLNFFTGTAVQLGTATPAENGLNNYSYGSLAMNINLIIKRRSKNLLWKKSFLDKSDLPIKIEIYNFIIKNKSWTKINRFKKHISVDHCKKFYLSQIEFRKKWLGVSGIYNITLLRTPLNLFSYYGSSKNLGERLKIHYYNGKNQNTFLGLLIFLFGCKYFTVTIIETCPIKYLKERENWYLKTFNPLFNILTNSYSNAQKSYIVSKITRVKISSALKGWVWSEEIKQKRKASIFGNKHPNFG